MLLTALLLSACTPDAKVVGDDTTTGGDGDGTTTLGNSDDVDDDGYRESVDCDDADATVHPGADEVWYDGVDQDCDGADDDQDGDGYLFAEDCDDTDPASYPGAGEVPDDGVDQDCDGSDTRSVTDADGDGFPSTVDCDDGDATVYPGAADTAGDGVDSNCDGTDAASEEANADADGDGWANADFGGPDCDDTNAAINPDAAETAGDDVDSDCDGADYGVDGLATGDLVISEIMYDPDAVSDSVGEWFEVYNGTGHTVNLLDLVVADDGAYGAADMFTVDTDLVVTAGQRVVFAVSGDTASNGGIAADYDFPGGGVNFNNGADDLYLGVANGRGGYATIDSVSYDELAGWPLAKGVSIELNDAKLTSSANDSASNWCTATSTAGTTTDKGSPGAASSGC